MFPVKRTQVSLRSASPDDAPVLAEVWAEVLRRADRDRADRRSRGDHRARDSAPRRSASSSRSTTASVAGAVHLRATTLTPINLEPVVQAISPHVLPEFRRRGVGRALMEAAVAFAEERGIAHIATAAVSGSRDANRFMARLALGPHAILRLAPDRRGPGEARRTGTRPRPPQRPLWRPPTHARPGGPALHPAGAAAPGSRLPGLTQHLLLAARWPSPATDRLGPCP